MTDFAWDSRKSARVFFESKAFFRLNRRSKKEAQLQEKTIAAKPLDLSLHGVALECSAYVPVGTKLNIFWDKNTSFPPPKGSKRRFSKIVGIVRNSSQIKGHKYRLEVEFMKHHYRIGIQFEKLSTEDKKLIHDFIGSSERREDRRVTKAS